MTEALNLHCNPDCVLAYANFNRLCAQAVYTQFMALIGEYAESGGYTKAPDGGSGLLYYRKKVDRIEILINQIYENEGLSSALRQIARAFRNMVCSYDFPGVPSGWYKINPVLRFYTPPFYAMKTDYKTYEEIKNGNSKIAFDYYPRPSELEDCNKYFTHLECINKAGNYRYTEDEFFQMELCNTVKTIFHYINKQYCA